jgi:four helix bundle protein
MQDFKKLKVWEKAHHLVLTIYGSAKQFPTEELYGLTNQMRRAATSIVCNIAEGCGRSGKLDFARFLQIAAGSGSELEYQILLAYDLSFFNRTESQALGNAVIDVKRMLSSLMQRLRIENC